MQHRKLPTFNKGKILTSDDMNLIVNELRRLGNMYGSGVRVVHDAGGVHLGVDTSSNSSWRIRNDDPVKLLKGSIIKITGMVDISTLKGTKPNDEVGWYVVAEEDLEPQAIGKCTVSGPCRAIYTDTGYGPPIAGEIWGLTPNDPTLTWEYPGWFVLDNEATDTEHSYCWIYLTPLQSILGVSESTINAEDTAIRVQVSSGTCRTTECSDTNLFVICKDWLLSGDEQILAGDRVICTYTNGGWVITSAVCSSDTSTGVQLLSYMGGTRV
jgi:hypothetical protein